MDIPHQEACSLIETLNVTELTLKLELFAGAIIVIVGATLSIKPTFTQVFKVALKLTLVEFVLYPVFVVFIV